MLFNSSGLFTRLMLAVSFISIFWGWRFELNILVFTVSSSRPSAYILWKCMIQYTSPLQKLKKNKMLFKAKSAHPIEIAFLRSSSTTMCSASRSVEATTSKTLNTIKMPVSSLLWKGFIITIIKSCTTEKHRNNISNV